MMRSSVAHCKTKDWQADTKACQSETRVTKFFCLLYAFMLWPEWKTSESLILSFESDKYFLDKLHWVAFAQFVIMSLSLSLDFSPRRPYLKGTDSTKVIWIFLEQILYIWFVSFLRPCFVSSQLSFYFVLNNNRGRLSNHTSTLQVHVFWIQAQTCT